MTHIKTFRGFMANDTVDTISLHTNNGSIGYRIVKFQTIGSAPGISGHAEAVCKIYSVPQTVASVDGVINFNDQTLIAVSTWSSSSDSWMTYQTIVVDDVIINQDIYITFTDEQGNISLNYYIELEQFKLDLNENTVATLKDIRNITAPT